MSDARQTAEPGVLYVVATPLGHLRDITLRALDILGSVDLIACEDTRTTLKLLSHFGLRGPRLVSLHEHNERKRTPWLIEALRRGQSVALVSEAGTPGLSDPGAGLVAAAHEEGLRVSPVPGPSALCTALSVSGLPLGNGALFLGFLPARAAARRRVLAALAREERPVVLYEAPHRLAECLRDMCALLGEGRRVFLAREMTKRHEECGWWRLADLRRRVEEEGVRGEVTLVLAGQKEAPPAEDDLREELRGLLAQGLSLREASRLLAARHRLPGKEIYRLGLSLKDSPSPAAREEES